MEAIEKEINQYYCPTCDSGFYAEPEYMDIPEGLDTQLLPTALNYDGATCPTCGLRVRKVDNYSKFSLQTKRHYFMWDINLPYLDTIVSLAKKFKVLPDTGNCKKESSQAWLRIWDKFKRHSGKVRKDLFDSIWTVFVYKNEADPVYRERGKAVTEWLVEEIIEGRFPYREDGFPADEFWIEDERGKGFDFIKLCYESESFRTKLKELMEAESA